MKKYISILCLVSAIALPTFASYAHDLPHTPTTQKTQAPRAKGVWIDVRSADEFKQGHLSNAINVPHDKIAQQIAQIEPNKNAPINLYCRSGRRAEVALQELKKLGYNQVINHGGYDDLIKQGLK